MSIGPESEWQYDYKVIDLFTTLNTEGRGAHKEVRRSSQSIQDELQAVGGKGYHIYGVNNRFVFLMKMYKEG